MKCLPDAAVLQDLGHEVHHLSTNTTSHPVYVMNGGLLLTSELTVDVVST